MAEKAKRRKKKQTSSTQIGTSNIRPPPATIFGEKK